MTDTASAPVTPATPAGTPPEVKVDHDTRAAETKVTTVSTLSEDEKRERAKNVLAGKPPEGDDKKPAKRKAKEVVPPAKEQPAKEAKAKEAPATPVTPDSEEPDHATQKKQLAKQAREVARNAERLKAREAAAAAKEAELAAREKEMEEDLLEYAEKHYGKKGSTLKDALIQRVKSGKMAAKAPEPPKEETRVALPPEVEELVHERRQQEGKAAAEREVKRHLAYLESNPIDPDTHPELAEFSDEFVAREMLAWAIDDYHDHLKSGGRENSYQPLDSDELRDRIEAYYRADRNHRESGRRQRESARADLAQEREPGGQSTKRESARTTIQDVPSRARPGFRKVAPNSKEERRQNYKEILSGGAH